ncbi:MAG: CDP-diacylglycerol--serine O-phosphatidyltransferase [Bacteroidota bacterium]|nr:CDP-diacylglycerol--serine O-phosphatidyltransferase [Bacteroidota bacterium]
MSITKHVPNTITSLNLVFGLLSVIAALNGELFNAGIFIFIAAIMDFFDGFAARLLNAVTPIGKELDSLADMVSFGAAPGMIVYSMLLTNQTVLVFNGVNILPYFALLIPVLSALRLANFNIDTRQSDSFIGLPVPANASFIAAIAILLSKEVEIPNMLWMVELFENGWVLITVAIILALMLVSHIHLFSLKFKNFSFKNNIVRYLFLIAALVLIFLFSFAAIPFIIVLYIVLSVIVNYIFK